eukprot:7292271-Pyramimonas_sp.AAC.1
MQYTRIRHQKAPSTAHSTPPHTAHHLACGEHPVAAFAAFFARYLRPPSCSHQRTVPSHSQPPTLLGLLTRSVGGPYPLRSKGLLTLQGIVNALHSLPACSLFRRAPFHRRRMYCRPRHPSLDFASLD